MNFDCIDFNKAKANENYVIIYKDYRITVFNEFLFRIEHKSEQFLDYPTQSIWYRNFSSCSFDYEIKEEIITITCNNSKLVVNTFDFLKSYIILNNKKYKLNNKYNLKGTTRTLDMSPEDYIHYDDPLTNERYDIHYKNKKVLDNGVCSKKGVSIIDDSKSLIIKPDGTLSKNTLLSDIYVFAYQTNYKEAVKALYSLTGNPPMLPKYVFGNWWSRYWAYSDDEYLRLLDKFHEKNIPLTVATIDMDWHYVDVDSEFNLTNQGLTDEKYGELHGWTGFTWNHHLFKDYKKFLKEIKNRNLKITLNLHPASGIRWFEKDYSSSAINMGINPNSKECVTFDFTNEKFINTYFNLLNGYEKDGVDFWWIDWQQGNKSKLEGYDPLWGLNHFHYYDLQKDGKRSVILSRYCGIGSHRYPLGFSGDTTQKWHILKYVIYFTLTSTNIGYTFWSHDIGAHHGGYKDSELYIRWLQFALFNPINRLHSASGELYGKEPYNYDKSIELLAIDLLQRRHNFIPYIYTFSCLTYQEGISLIQPMYYNIPMDDRSYKYKEQYYFNDLIVSPIVTKIDKTSSLANKKVFLPEGNYTDIYTNIKYKGNQEIEVYRYIDEIPCFAKDGTIVYKATKMSDINNIESYSLNIYKGNGKTHIYEDDGVSLKFKEGKYIKTFIEQNYDIVDNTLYVKIYSKGDYSLIPEKRDYILNIINNNIEEVYDDYNNAIEYQNDFDYAIIKLNKVITNKGINLKIKLKKFDQKTYLLNQIKRVLIKLNYDNEYIHKLFEQIKVSSIDEIKNVVEISTLPLKTKKHIFEIINCI